MQVEVIKPFRYGLRIFSIGEIGEVVEVDYPLTFQGKSIYDLYVKFPNHKPIGVHKEEVEPISQQGGNPAGLPH